MATRTAYLACKPHQLPAERPDRPRWAFARLVRFPTLLLAISVLALPGLAWAQESDEELAKKLSNPVASLISVPLQLNYDRGFGPDDNGDRFVLNIQPVVPIPLNEEWNLISRTIVPVIGQQDLYPGAGSQSGIGDIVQSLFFSPAAPTKNGLIWGVGPAILLPTGSDDRLTADQWGLGPTAVFLKQAGPSTYGALVNHIESVGGSDDRADISSTFVQPFYSRTTPNAWTYAANLETTYDWERKQWSVPINLTATKVTRWGSQLVSLGGGVRYWIEAPNGGAEGFGARVLLAFLFPR